jgi:hypothetical protein
MIIRMPRINKKPKAIPMLNFKEMHGIDDDWHVQFIEPAGLAENQYVLAEKRILAQAESMAASYPQIKAITAVQGVAQPGRSSHQMGIAQDNHLTSKLGARKRLLEEMTSEDFDFATKTPQRPALTDEQIRAIVRDEMNTKAIELEKVMRQRVMTYMSDEFDRVLKELVHDLKLTVGTLSDQVDEIWEELRDGA